MHRRISSFLALALLPAAVAAAPGESTDSPDVETERSQAGASESRQQSELQTQPGDPAQQTPGTQQPGQTEEINLIATDDLIGRDVTTQEGERLGTLAFVTVSLDQGSVSHLVVDTAGTDFAPGAQRPGATQPGAPQPGTPAQPGTPGEPGTPAQPGSPAQPGTPDQPGTPGQPGATAQPDPTTEPGADRQAQAAQQDQGNLLIVPWSVVNVDTRSDAVVVAATGRHIMNAPRLEREQLNQLTEPAVASYVIDYWAPASELAALESERGQQQNQAGQGDRQGDVEKNRQDRDRRPMEQQESPEDPQLQPDQAQADDPKRMQENRDVGSATDPSTRDADPSTRDDALAERSESAPIGELAESERRSSQQDPGQAPGQTPEQARQQAQPQIGQTSRQSAGGGNQVVLVGQEVVAAVTPPMFQLGEQLRGATVLDRSGQEIGEIRQIMIDSRTGDAAFAVIEGTSAGRAPVPLQALEWNAEGTTMLTADASNLQSDQGLTEQPGQASRQELSQLYERFGARPYWEGSTGELRQ